VWASSGPGFTCLKLSEVLGDDVALTGKGQHGNGAIVSLLTRRLLPVHGRQGAEQQQQQQQQENEQ
jgi:hypothetical protein